MSYRQWFCFPGNLNRQFSLLFLGMAMYDNIYES